MRSEELPVWWIFGIAVIIALGYLWGRARQHRISSGREIAARADQQTEQYLDGDFRGLYGIFIPAVPGSEDALLAPEKRPPLPGPKPTLQAALERQETSSDQRAIRRAGEAARGRGLVDQFIAELERHGVPPDILYEESRGPTSWSYSTVAGKGWMLEDLGSERSHFEYHYVLPGRGIAKVVQRLPENEMIKVICYGTRPDNTDHAYAMWASRADQLALQARHLIATTRSTR